MSVCDFIVLEEIGLRSAFVVVRVASYYVDIDIDCMLLSGIGLSRLVFFCRCGLDCLAGDGGFHSVGFGLLCEAREKT